MDGAAFGCRAHHARSPACSGCAVIYIPDVDLVAGLIPLVVAFGVAVVAAGVAIWWSER